MPRLKIYNTNTCQGEYTTSGNVISGVSNIVGETPTPTANLIPVLDSNGVMPSSALGGEWLTYTPTIPGAISITTTGNTAGNFNLGGYSFNISGFLEIA